ncbi:hypothetical protein AgCh_000720 [Apium graveolens]
MRAMYGSVGEELVIQSTVLQLLFWLPIFLFMLEVRRTRRNSSSVAAFETDIDQGHFVGEVDASAVTPSVLALIKTALRKLLNPICLACIAGLVWALLASWWHFEMPSIMEGCILIVSKAAVGTYMFCMGLFMAINKKIDENWSIGVPITSILWRFIMGPICLGLACLCLGLDGEVLKAAIMQATLPPAYLSFYYAQEYRLDIDCISHGVIYGTLFFLPIVLVYFAVLEWFGHSEA